MSSTLDEQINQLKRSIAEMESQRKVLGDETVEAALVPLRSKLAKLVSRAEAYVGTSQRLPARQRKLVTLLYVDVVGSTAMTQNLDPEDTMEIMDNALQKLAIPVGSHGGHVTRFMGDGFMSLFGDPITREDDPEQAVHAGLEILEVAKSLSKDFESQWDIVDFNVRIGINTGFAVLGGFTEAEDTVMGSPVNLAARIENAAPPGGLLISHNTYRHVQGLFNVEPQEPIMAKGFPEPVPVYLVESIKPRAFRMQTRGVEGVQTQMIGRGTELNTLKGALLTVIEEGKGQVITVSGEAGVGKSRLLFEFQNWVELLPESIFIFQGRGRRGAQGHPYGLVRDMFAFRFQILDDDTTEITRHKFEAGICEVFGNEKEGEMRAHIIGQLLGFDFSASTHLKGVLNDAEQLRNRSLMYLGDYFLALSGKSLVVILFEDIHWGDDSSLDVIKWLEERITQFSLLIVCAARHSLIEKRPDWIRDSANHHQLKLFPLSEKESIHLIDEILRLVNEVPKELHELLINKAEGNPFYLEEMIKMLIEDGVVVQGDEAWHVEVEQLARVKVPSTLMGVLQARLERLPPQERAILQQASTVGRIFWDQLLVYIQEKGSGITNPQFVSLILSSLQERELIYRREESAFASALEYLFKHDILREVTYESVIKRLRTSYHGLVADWLISNSRDRTGEYGGLIAEHLLQAGRGDQAREYFFIAGESALNSYANKEAENFYRKSLELAPPDLLRAKTLSGLGMSLSRLANIEQAANIWYEAIDLYTKLEDFDHLAETYAHLTRLFSFSDQPEGWRVCNKGLDSMKAAPDSSGYARLLAEAGRLAYFRNETDQVIPLCQQAMVMAQRLGDLEVYVEASNTIALNHDDILEKISILEDVVELAEKNGLLRAAARSHHNLAVYLFDSHLDVTAGLQHQIRAVEIYKQMGELYGMIEALNALAEDYIELGYLSAVEEKLANLLKSSSIPKSLENDFWQEVHRLQMIRKGEWQPAIEAISRSLKIYRETGNIAGILGTNSKLVEVILEINKYENSYDLSEAEHALLENFQIDPEDEYSIFYMVVVCARQGRIADAYNWLTKSKPDHSHDEKDFASKEFRLYLEFELAYAQERWTEAIRACESSSKLLHDNGRHWQWARRLIDLGDTLLARNEPGDLERARETYQQSLKLFTEMGATGYIKVLEERLENL